MDFAGAVRIRPASFLEQRWTFGKTVTYIDVILVSWLTLRCWGACEFLFSETFFVSPVEKHSERVTPPHRSVVRPGLWTPVVLIMIRFVFIT